MEETDRQTDRQRQRKRDGSVQKLERVRKKETLAANEMGREILDVMEVSGAKEGGGGGRR